MDYLYLQLESFDLAIPTVAQIQALDPVIILGSVLLIFVCLLALMNLYRLIRFAYKRLKTLLKAARNSVFSQIRNTFTVFSVHLKKNLGALFSFVTYHTLEAINSLSSRYHDFQRKCAINSELRKQKLSLVTLLNEMLQRQKNISELNREYTRLKDVNFKRMSPGFLLKKANSNELANLRKVLLMEQGGHQDIATEIRSVGSHTLGTLFRRIGGSDPHVPYMEVLDDVLEQVGGSADKEHSDFEKECQIIEQYTSQMMAEMSDAEQQQFIDGLKQEAEKNGESFAGIIGAGGSIVLANASGFGVYLLASTTVGSITGILGITLPFAFYTSMSSTIAVVTGPVGWTVLALWGVSKVGSPNKKKTLPSVIMIAAVRARLITENETLVKLAEKRRDKDIPRIREEIGRRVAKVDHIKQSIDKLKQQLVNLNA